MLKKKRMAFINVYRYYTYPELTYTAYYIRLRKGAWSLAREGTPESARRARGSYRGVVSTSKYTKN